MVCEGGLCPRWLVYLHGLLEGVLIPMVTTTSFSQEIDNHDRSNRTAKSPRAFLFFSWTAQKQERKNQILPKTSTSPSHPQKSQRKHRIFQEEMSQIPISVGEFIDLKKTCPGSTGPSRHSQGSACPGLPGSTSQCPPTLPS